MEMRHAPGFLEMMMVSLISLEFGICYLCDFIRFHPFFKFELLLRFSSCDIGVCVQSGTRKDERGTERKHREGGAVCHQITKKVWTSSWCWL